MGGMGKGFFVIRGSVAWWSEQRSGSQELSDLAEALRGLLRGSRQVSGPRRAGSPTLNLPSEELLTQGQEVHSRKPDSLSAK